MCSVPTSTPYYIYARGRRCSGRKPYEGDDAKVLRKLKITPPMLKVLNRTIFLGIRRRKTHSAGGRTGTESSETKKKNRKTEQRTAIADYRTDKTKQGTEKNRDNCGRNVRKKRNVCRTGHKKGRPLSCGRLLSPYQNRFVQILP